MTKAAPVLALAIALMLALGAGGAARAADERSVLTYHGTTDPAIYGIDYLPYLGGMPGTESDWIAVSSYYFVGLGQKMMTQHGRTERARVDFGDLRRRKPDAVLGGCMYLFRFR